MMARRNLPDFFEQRPVLIRAQEQTLKYRFPVPARGDASGEQRFDLRGQVEDAPDARIKERLDAKAVARREQRLLILVPDDEREFTAQLLQTFSARLFVKVKGDLAVGARAKPVPARFEVAPNPFVVVKLSVDHDAQPTVLAGYRLRPRHQVDNAEPRAAQPDPTVRRRPMMLLIWSTMCEPLGGPHERLRHDWLLGREKGDYAAHKVPRKAVG